MLNWLFSCQVSSSKKDNTYTKTQTLSQYFKQRLQWQPCFVACFAVSFYGVAADQVFIWSTACTVHQRWQEERKQKQKPLLNTQEIRAWTGPKSTQSVSYSILLLEKQQLHGSQSKDAFSKKNIERWSYLALLVCLSRIKELLWHSLATHGLMEVTALGKKLFLVLK